MSTGSDNGTDWLSKLKSFELDFSRFICCVIGILDEEDWIKQILKDPELRNYLKFCIELKNQTFSELQPVMDDETFLREQIDAGQLTDWHSKVIALFNDINDLCDQGLGKWLHPVMGSNAKLWVLELQTNLKEVIREVVNEEGGLVLSVNKGKIKQLLDQLCTKGKLLATVVESLSKNQQLFQTKEKPKVILRKRHEKPIVLGKELGILNEAEYDVVEALVKAGDAGLSKDAIEEVRSSARAILVKLKNLPGWKEVIHMAGKSYHRYRIG